MKLKERKKIGWIQIFSRRDGGIIYGERVRNALSPHFDLELRNIEAKYLSWKYLKPLEWIWQLRKQRGKKDLWIRDDLFSIAFLSLNKMPGKKLVIIYHIDSSIFSFIFRPLFFLLEKIFYYKLKKVNTIVTISQYWKNYFLEKGYSNVYKTYCGFNLADFKISDQEILKFKKKFGLEKKPIIYIGNCQKAKGVVESYSALKDLDVHLVTSGEQRVKIPAKNFDLDYKNYLRLLKASSIVITMSKFKEGWCMTAHEAMLLKRPVIGSGRGGMRELLEDGGQIICEDFSNLKEKVEYLLNNPETRKKIGEAGFNFAKNFSQEKFNREWISLIKKLTS